jgi:AGZA family xanthine/uracil permease-like MFS transporter
MSFSGLLSYVVLNGMIYSTKKISRGYLIPENDENRELWTWKPQGELPWFIRLTQNPKEMFSSRDVKESTESRTSSSIEEKA